MLRLLILCLLFVSCTRLHNSHNRDILDCGPELTRGQEYLTVVNARGIRMTSGFEVINLASGKPENLATSRGCIVKKSKGRYLVRSTGTDEARIIDLLAHENHARIELYDYSGQGVSVPCKDQVKTVGNDFDLQSLLLTNVQSDLQDAVHLEYEFVKPARPKASFSLAEATQALPLRGETDERVYELKLVVSNLLSMGKVEATCRLQLDRTPPQAFVSINGRQPEDLIEVHGTKNIASVGLVDSLTFLTDKDDGVTISYCLVPLSDDFDEADKQTMSHWIGITGGTSCEGHKHLIASSGAVIASDVKSGFWSIKFQAADSVGNLALPQVQNILVLNKDNHRLIRDNAQSSIGAKSSMKIVERALRAEVLRKMLPTRYERDLEREIALSGLLKAYYQENVSVEINAHNSSVTAMALSEDGKVMVSSSYDRTLKLWSVDTGQLIWTVAADSLKNIALSPNLKYIVGIDIAGSVQAFNAEDGSYLRMIKGRDRPGLTPTRIQFGPDNISILLDFGNDIEIRSVENGEKLRGFKGHTKKVRDIGVVPGGKLIVSVADDRTLRFWDFSTGENLKTVETKVSANESLLQDPTRVTVSADGMKVGVRLATGVVGVWNNDGSFVKWSGTASGDNIAVKQDGTVITANKDVRIWSGDNVQVTLDEHASPISGIALSMDENRLITASDDSTIRIWNLKIIQEKKILKAPHEITSLVYTQDGKNLISGSLGSAEVLLWSPETSDSSKALAIHKSSGGPLAISGNGKYVASGGADGDIIVLESEGACCRILDFKPAEALTSVSLSNDGRYLVAATTSGGVKRWDLNSSNEPFDVSGPFAGGTVAAIGPDASFVAIAGLGAQSSIEIRDLQTGALLFPIMGNAGFMSGLSFSADSRKLATIGPSYNSINVWDLPSRTVVSKVVGDFKEVVSLALTARGTRAVAGTLIGKFLMIDFEEEQQILIPMHGREPSFAVAIAPDGRTFATGAYDRTIRIWDLDNGPIHENICARLKNYLAPELCSDFP